MHAPYTITRKKFTINDNDRESHVDNSEGWYHAQRRSGLSRRNFVIANRAEIDAEIRKINDRV